MLINKDQKRKENIADNMIRFVKNYLFNNYDTDTLLKEKDRVSKEKLKLQKQIASGFIKDDQIKHNINLLDSLEAEELVIDEFLLSPSEDELFYFCNNVLKENCDAKGFLNSKKHVYKVNEMYFGVLWEYKKEVKRNIFFNINVIKKIDSYQAIEISKNNPYIGQIYETANQSKIQINRVHFFDIDVCRDSQIVNVGYSKNVDYFDDMEPVCNYFDGKTKEITRLELSEAFYKKYIPTRTINRFYQ